MSARSDMFSLRLRQREAGVKVARTVRHTLVHGVACFAGVLQT